MSGYSLHAMESHLVHLFFNHIEPMLQLVGAKPIGVRSLIPEHVAIFILVINIINNYQKSK